ncbi:MAG: hypothetical protein CFE26_18625, partial [Verrucomicrobiales bacterium VVV1]
HAEHCEHDHDEDHAIGGTSAGADSSKHQEQAAKKSSSYRDLLDELNKVASTRTNPKAATKAHLFDMRRQIENKLGFAYELDPSHYGNYNSYHFFLTEPQLGTRPELTPGAAKLADSTIDYCLRRNDDPRPALTAAAAAENELELMFSEPARFTKEQMMNRLSIVDFSLARHKEISKQWLENGNWELISPMRQEEIFNRFKFLSRVRDAAEGTIRRLDGQPNLGQASN